MATTTYTDRTTWEAALTGYGDIDLTQGGLYDDSDVIPGGTDLSSPYSKIFDITGDVELWGPVPLHWATWSGGNTPYVYFPRTYPPTDIINMNFTSLSAFGFEAQPNVFNWFDITMTLSDSTILVQSVHGNGGAKFFGFISDANITTVNITIPPESSGFAVGRLILALLDKGCRIFDGANVIDVGVENLVATSHKLRVRKGTTTYGIPLLTTTDSKDNGIRTYDGVAIKALPKTT